jgi:hypothetical protein
MPATYAQIMTILVSQDFDVSDKLVVRWQFRLLDGDFERPLWECIKCADSDNLERLSRGFPTEVEGFRRWAYGDLGYRLRAAGLSI